LGPYSPGNAVNAYLVRSHTFSTCRRLDAGFKSTTSDRINVSGSPPAHWPDGLSSLSAPPNAPQLFPKTLLIALCYSFIFYLGGGVTFLLVCKAFAIHITLTEAISVRVFTYLLTLIPISIGGLGLTQAGDVYLLGILGVDATHAFGISIVRQLINYGYVLIGGILFVRSRDRQLSVPLQIST
jgi:uncharacterized membrane protein YbhN (UPF0104 family)